MLRLSLIAFYLFLSLISLAGRDELDQYNRKTIDLLDDPDSSLRRVEYAIEEAKSINYDYGEAYAYYLKGYILRMQHDLGKAFLANLKGLNLLQGDTDKRTPETLVRLYINTGEILKKHFKYDEAIEYFLEGLKIAKKENLEKWIIDLHYNLGNTYKWKGNYNQAYDYLLDAYLHAKRKNDEHTIVNALNQMGLIFKENQNYDSAIVFFDKMISYPYEALSSAKYKGRAYHNLANTYAYAGDTVPAYEAFKKALEYKTKRNNPSEIFITENDFAELLFAKGEFEQASIMAENCIESYEKVRLHPDHYKVFDLFRKISASKSDYIQADKYADRFFIENEKFIRQQENLIEIRDKFKMEVLAASFLGELERNKRISILQTSLICVLIIAIVIIAYLKGNQIMVRTAIQKELLEWANE